jgi:hypothetical protein
MAIKEQCFHGSQMIQEKRQHQLGLWRDFEQHITADVYSILELLCLYAR